MKIDHDYEAIYMTGAGGQSSERLWSLRVSAEMRTMRNAAGIAIWIMLTYPYVNL